MKIHLFQIYATCSAYISPKLAKKVKSTSHLKSILGGVAGATSVKLKVSGKGQYLLSGPAEELLEAQKMLTKVLIILVYGILDNSVGIIISIKQVDSNSVLLALESDVQLNPL